VRESGIVRDMGQGPIQTTAAPFDVAIQGPGFFAVRGDNGTLYTRDGAFTLSADGTLTTREGRPVLSDSGAPLVFDTRGETPTIDSEGAVKIAGVEAGRIGVFSFAAPASLQKVGDNLYDPAGQAATAADSRIVQGALEGSNVRPVVELTRLMEIARAYESAARMISNDDDLRRTAVDRLGRAAA
jgi:flagellar basal-body rod protein FlgF